MYYFSSVYKYRRNKMKIIIVLVIGVIVGFGLVICKKLIEVGYKVIGMGRCVDWLVEIYL